MSSDGSADYERPDQNLAGGSIQPPSITDFMAELNQSLARHVFRVKIVVENELGDEIIFKYLPGTVKWGSTVDIKATLEARIS